MKARRRRWLLSLAVVVALLAAALAVRWQLARRPTYQGKTAADWFHEYLAARGHYRVPATWAPGSLLAPGSQTAWTIDVERWRRDPAADGLRALGTNAAVYLGEQVRRRDRLWAKTYRRCFVKLPPWLRRLAPLPPQLRDLVHIDCTEALTVLGPDAAPAVPALIEALRDSGSASHWTIIRTLRQLPFKPEELDPFLEDLRRKGEFTNALRDVADLGVRTPAAARLLGAALSTADPATRRSAASQFANFGPNAVVALPALTAALSDQDQGVRYESANALESLGTNALPAVPALMQATNDASVMVQRAAARALQKIGAKPAEETLRSPSAR